MRKDTSFSDKKLTVDEFSKKYWRNGQFPYQYHTATIEDGRDEREQFLFNNNRALYDLIGANAKNNRAALGEIEKSFSSFKRKITALVAANAVIVVAIVLIIMLLRR